MSEWLRANYDRWKRFINGSAHSPWILWGGSRGKPNTLGNPPKMAALLTGVKRPAAQDVGQLRAGLAWVKSETNWKTAARYAQVDWGSRLEIPGHTWACYRTNPDGILHEFPFPTTLSPDTRPNHHDRALLSHPKQHYYPNIAEFLDSCRK